MSAGKVFGVEAIHEGTEDDTATQFNCAARTGARVVAAAETALSDFKNPYSPSASAVRDSSSAPAAKADMGYVNIAAAGDTITVTTCFQNDCATASTDNVVNEIEVAE